MMESILKTINVSIVQTLCLTSSSRLQHGHPLVIWEFLQKELSDDLALSVIHFHSSRKQLPNSPIKTTYFHMQISLSEFVLPLSVGHQVVQPCTDL